MKKNSILNGKTGKCDEFPGRWKNKNKWWRREEGERNEKESGEKRKKGGRQEKERRKGAQIIFPYCHPKAMRLSLWRISLSKDAKSKQRLLEYGIRGASLPHPYPTRSVVERTGFVTAFSPQCSQFFPLLNHVTNRISDGKRTWWTETTFIRMMLKG